MAPFSLSRRGLGALSFGALLLVAAQGRAETPAEEGRANPYAEERALREGSGRDAVPSKELAEASSEGPAEVSAEVSAEERGPVAEAQAQDDLSEPLAEKETSAVVPQGVGDGSTQSGAPDEPVVPERDASPSAERVTAIALTTLAFVGVGVGTSYAIRATSARRQADGACDPVCTAEGYRLDREARRSVTVAQIALATGVVALGGAAYLWFLEPSRAATSTTTAYAPRPTWQFDVQALPGEAAGWVRGTF